LGLTYPLPTKKIQDFIKRYKSVLVVEELEPILEEEINRFAKNINPKLKVYGKNILPKSGEFTEEIIISAIERIIKKEFRIGFEEHLKKYKQLELPRRFAILCPGCPHRASFWSVKMAAGKDTVFGGDIGCYILGMFPPYNISDFFFSMGASAGVIHGIKKTTFQKAISFLGDSTFFHAGIPGIINIVFNKSNPLIIIMDNRITGMTGHQPNPGSGMTGMGEFTKIIRIEDIVKACGVKNVRVIDPFNIKKMIKTVRRFMKKKDVSVIVAKRECRLLTVRRFQGLNVKLPKFEIKQKKCKRCGTCLNMFACPAIYNEGDDYKIDRNLCTGCGVCAQICSNKAIRAVKK
jgi:indolepyruvate ferredoxin oxidoreductase alpha subunit